MGLCMSTNGTTVHDGSSSYSNQLQHSKQDLLNSKGSEAQSCSQSPSTQAQGQHTRSAAQNQKSIRWIVGETADVRSLYDFGKLLGKGQFGTTRLVTEKSTGKQFACKSIAKSKLHTAEELDDVKREVQIMHHLNGHPNVVHMYAAYEDGNYVHLILELCSGGELFDRIVQQGHYTEKAAAEIFRTMVSVIQHCHGMGILHRDLKPENFLLADKSKHAAIKATDFGLSTFFKEGEVFKDIVGSAFYVAPEVLKRCYSKEADIWSLGVMLYILLCGVPPFYGDNDQQIFQQIKHGHVDFKTSPWPSISDAAKDCIKHMLTRDPAKRATIEEILNHPWVRKNGVAKDAPIQSEVLNRLQGFAQANKLKKEAMKVIASSLPDDEIRGLREMFHSIDVDNSGTITLDELHHALKVKGTHIPADELKRIMTDTDINGDGTIDYEEFLAATIHTSKLENEDNILKAFQHFDKDASGFITKEELLEGLSKVVPDPQEIDRIIAQVDQNNDGLIDFAEFKLMMTSRAEAAARKVKG